MLIEFYLNSLDRSIPIRRGLWLVLIISMFIEIPVFNANSVDSGSTLCNCPFMGR